jgi:uncharacterized protein YeaO (DUF488 family)
LVGGLSSSYFYENKIGGMAMLRIYTTQIRRNNPACLDPAFLNITVKNGDKTFAPTWNMVMGVKNKTMTEEEYSSRYINLMTESYKNNSKRWHDLLTKDKLILGCFCPKGTFCHRYQLAHIILAHCSHLGIEVQYCGEI